MKRGGYGSLGEVPIAQPGRSWAVDFDARGGRDRVASIGGRRCLEDERDRKLGVKR